jgi:phytanoyl-CoA hydroxylase
MKFLTEDQKKFYQENGFILLSNVFSEEEFEVISNEYSKVFKVTTNRHYPL